MLIKKNYILIPLITIAVALIGSQLTNSGMIWYNAELILPALTPPKAAFPIAWTTIFILTTISALIFWNKIHEKNWRSIIFFWEKDKKNELIIALFIINAFLNVFWSFLFFNQHMITAAFIEMILLEATIAALILLLWKILKWASILLLPYLIWVGFATYLTWEIMTLNT